MTVRSLRAAGPRIYLDDHVLPGLGWSRARIRGRKPALSDAELLCLAAAPHLLGISSECKWIRHAPRHLAGTFPAPPGQSDSGKRLRNQSGLVSAAIAALTPDIPSWHEDLRLVDSTPLPCGTSRETVKRSDRAGHTGYGYCPAHSRYFWGCRLYLVSTAEGMPVIWGLANPAIGEREIIRALLEHDHRLVRAGQGDKGFARRHSWRMGLLRR